VAPQISAAKDAMAERYPCGGGAMEVVSLAVVIASFRSIRCQMGHAARAAFPRRLYCPRTPAIDVMTIVTGLRALRAP